MYVKITNTQEKKFPYSMGDLHKENPDTSFPATISAETLAAFGVYKVTEVSAPVVDSKTHRQVQDVEKINDTWTQVWRVHALPKDRAAANIRVYRNTLLSDSDWTQVADAPVDRLVWFNYRQKLRDISLQPQFPWTVIWPEQP